jgi:hypothetical protein
MKGNQKESPRREKEANESQMAPELLILFLLLFMANCFCSFCLFILVHVGIHIGATFYGLTHVAVDQLEAVERRNESHGGAVFGFSQIRPRKSTWRTVCV